MASAGIFEVLVTEFINRGKVGVMLHVGAGMMAITILKWPEIISM